MLYLRANGYPKSRQQHDATIDKLESGDTVPIKPSVKVLVIRGIVIIIYLLLGGLVFYAIEHKERDKTFWKRKLDKERNQLLKDFNITLKRLSEFEMLIKRRRLEIFAEHKDWDYYQSLYFSSTVTTTIGYGHITPQTQGGRLFLIIFALIGIPLNILALASVGEHITVAIFYLLRYTSIKYCHRPKIEHINIKVMLVSVLLMVFMLFIGGMLYCYTEDWSYVDSIYYCFVAMATIGFGDLVPNHGRAPDTREEKAIWFLRALYISVGLSLVSTVFTALSNAMEEINLLLGRGKYANSWHPERNNDLKREGFYTIKNSKESEQISYKHKIKKHGNTVMKYKFLKQLSRKKKDNLIPNDWDGLLAEAKQKHAPESSPSVRCSPSVLRDIATKPTVVVLTDDKNPNMRKYSLQMNGKELDVRRVSLRTCHNKSEGGKSSAESGLESNLFIQPLKSECEIASCNISTGENCSPGTNFEQTVYKEMEVSRIEKESEKRKVARHYSTPDDFHTKNYEHQEVFRNHSHPQTRTDHNDTPLHVKDLHGRIDMCYGDISRLRANTWKLLPTADDYDIALNQC